MPSAIAFDFEIRVDRDIDQDDVSAALKGGDFCRVNLTGENVARKAEFLELFGIHNEDTDTPEISQFVARKDCIQFRLVDTQMAEGRFCKSPV